MNKKDILEAAIRDMKEAADADRDNRLEDMDDLEKLAGEHWPQHIKNERDEEDKPCLTFNRLPQFVRQVTGDIRRMNPAINVTAADDAASPETAEIIEGLIRQIEYQSDASSIYEQTAEQAAASSIGWFRVLHDYEDDNSFNQEILVKRIRNPFSVYADPRSELPTREDARYIFITESMNVDEYRETYKGKAEVEFDHDGATDGLEHWSQDGDVVVAEYYWKEPVKKKIHLLGNGQVIEDGEFVAPLDIKKTRTVETHKVMWAKVSGEDVLEGPKEQVSKEIPVIAITGEEWHVGDRVRRSSVIRFAKDAQQMYNYWRSVETEIIALQPKAPYMVTAKQVQGLETFWNEANRKNRPYLPYNPDEKAPGAPQRASPPISSSGMAQQVMSAAEDMKATTGIYDAGLGNKSNEQSGVAIRQRQLESDVSTSIYSDNMAKAIAACGRLIVDMIPKIYDTRRSLRILSKDEKEKMVTVNDLQISQDGPMPVNDLTIGKYDIRVSVGPNYSTRRQETAEGMLEFIRVFPQSAPLTGDLVAKSMDWPDADQFAERLKKVLPPEVRDTDDLSPEERQAMQAAQQQQQIAAQKQEAAEVIEFRQEAAKADEAEAKAQEATVDLMQKQLELALGSGQLDAMIGQIVQQQVAQTLQGLMQQG